MSDRENKTEADSGFASRILSGARDLIWEADPTDRKQATTSTVGKTSDDKSASQPGTPNVRLIANAAPATAPTVLDGMSAELLSVVMNRPTAYSALAEAIAALADIPMDEATRFRSAFAVLKKTQQRTVEQIVQAVDIHQGVLDAEVTRFKGQSKSAEEGEITARFKEVAALNTAAEQAAAQIDKLRADTESRIRQLQDDLEGKQKRAMDLANEAEAKKRAILQTTQNFDAAIEAVKTILVREKSKIQQYLI